MLDSLELTELTAETEAEAPSPNGHASPSTSRPRRRSPSARAARSGGAADGRPSGPKKPATGGRNYTPKAAQTLAKVLAVGVRFPTIPLADALDEPQIVMLPWEAQAIADPAARLLWPWLKQQEWFLKLLETSSLSPDAAALVAAVWAYTSRTAIVAYAAYLGKVEAARIRAQAEGGKRGTHGHAGAVGASQPGTIPPAVGGGASDGDLAAFADFFAEGGNAFTESFGGTY